MKKPSWAEIERGDDHKSPAELMTPEWAKAIARIGKTEDGYHLEKFLMAVLTGAAPEGGDFGALSKFEGERKLARHLLQLMNRSANAPHRPDADRS